MRGHVEAVEVLLAKGADASLRNSRNRTIPECVTRLCEARKTAGRSGVDRLQRVAALLRGETVGLDEARQGSSVSPSGRGSAFPEGQHFVLSIFELI